LAPFIDLQEQGLDYAIHGDGMRDDRRATLVVRVPGPVRFAVLYWSGAQAPCEEAAGTCVVPSQPYRDQQMVFDGTSITGTVVGTDESPATPNGRTLHIGYLADVTTLLQARGVGHHTLFMTDGNEASNLSTLDGAALMVAFTEPGQSRWFRVMVWDGMDFVYGKDATPGATRTFAPVTFGHGERTFARRSRLSIVAGGGSATGADSITVSGNPTIVSSLNRSNDYSYDADSYPVTIPANAASTTVAVRSPSTAEVPDRLRVQVAALRLPTETRERGFRWLSPTVARPGINHARAGDILPLKFSLGGDFGRDVARQGWPRSQRFDCATGKLVDGSLYRTRPFGTGFGYFGEIQEYTYSWQTNAAWDGTCRAFLYREQNGVIHRVDVEFDQ
jgi:hypothetical protein